MRFSAHPERQAAFERYIKEVFKGIHGKIKPGHPWENGIIERSNRTDNDEFFNLRRFIDSEDRRYQHRLWEMHYNTSRPHQSLGLSTPMDVYLLEYPNHAKTRMLVC